jgi:hypothetical protein
VHLQVLHLLPLLHDGEVDGGFGESAVLRHGTGDQRWLFR